MHDFSNPPSRSTPVRPELLAPAGDWDCIRAAIENGADAVYFGLDIGFNARARAANFPLADLPRLMDTLHARGLKGYTTLNTLVFTNELDALEKVVRQIAAAGVDAGAGDVAPGSCAFAAPAGNKAAATSVRTKLDVRMGAFMADLAAGSRLCDRLLFF